jgi:hypothetical protein
MSNAREDLKFAVEQIDHVFGTGYAKAHPELVAAFIHADGMAHAAHVIGTSIDGLAENVRSDHPLMAETFSGITQALEDMADAIDHEGLRYIRRAAEQRMNGEKDQGM